VKCTPRRLFGKPALALSYRHDSLALFLPPRIVNGQDAPATTVRLDLWLWAARFYKTRALSKQMIESGKVEIGGQRAKPSRMVRVGDALRIQRGEEIFEIAVLAVSVQRGAASIAQTLYAESENSKRKRAEMLANLRAARAGYLPPESKPDKRARRLIRALGDIDAS
jgi:ribosome-associated heat shock protein Hsp15